MKKYAFIVSLLISVNAFAQSITPSEGLKYTDKQLNGTARFNGMAGAFGAVGGDMSAIGINPAGSLFFNYNTASFSLKYDNNKNEANYNGELTKRNSNSFDINQAGAVLVFSNPENTINKIAVSLNYENNSNFKNKYNFSGTSNESAIDQYFLDYANGTNGIGVFPIDYAADYNFSDFGNFADQQAWLGYNSYVLDYDDNAGEYYTNVPTGVTHRQAKLVNQKGFNSKLQFNFAAAIKNKLFLGMNLNAHISNSEKTFTIAESNNGLYDTGRTVNEIYFDNNIYTTGGGFSLDLGAIYRVNNNFRFGFAYASPTWYKFTDEMQQGIYTIRTEEVDPDTFLSNSIYPNYTTIFDSYKFKTPSKFTGSIAGIIGKNWLISADITTTDLSKTEYTSNGYNEINNFFKENLERTYEYRIGTEYAIKKVALRAGYRLIESPYKDTRLAPNKDTSTISGGIGYNFGISKLDLAYAFTDRNFNEEFISNNWSNTSNIKNNNHAVTLTYTVNF